MDGGVRQTRLRLVLPHVSAAGEHEPIDPSFVEVPITVAALRTRCVTSMRDVVAFAEQINHAEIHVLHGTHFIPLEFPTKLASMLDGGSPALGARR